MTLIKRFITRCYSQVDGLLEGVEDHQALIKSMLKEQERAINTARFEHHQLKQHLVDKQKLLAEKRHNIERWQERAKLECEVDEEKALLCLENKHRLVDEAMHIEQQLIALNKKSETLENEINQHIAAFKQQYDRYCSLKAESASAAVNQHLQSDLSESMGSLDDSFQRWEGKVFHQQAGTQCLSEELEVKSSLEIEYEKSEYQKMLASELAALRQASSDTHMQENDHE